MPLVVGVDSSTQSTKVEACDLDTGAVVATATAKHPPTTPPVSEQDPRAWWDALVTAFTELGDHRRDVVAISVAGQQHGLVLLDVVGNDVSLAIQRELYLEFREPGFAPAPLLEHLVTAGYLGRKTARGFRDYSAR